MWVASYFYTLRIPTPADDLCLQAKDVKLWAVAARRDLVLRLLEAWLAK